MTLPPLALVLLIASTGAGGQAVYRCEGNVYAATPCERGAEVAIEPGPSAQRRQEAAAVSRREAQWAERLVREREQREQREARRPPTPAIGIRGERGTPIEPTPPAGGPKVDARRNKGRVDEAGKKQRKPRVQPAQAVGKPVPACHAAGLSAGRAAAWRPSYFDISCSRVST